MRRTTKTDNKEKLLVDFKELKTILSCGTPTAYKIADEAGAAIKIGKRRLFNVRKIEDYLEAIAGGLREA